MQKFLRKLFRGKRQSPLEHFQEGRLECNGCARLLPLIEAEELSLQPCPHCQERNFVPKRIADYWLYAPIGGGGMGSVYKASHVERMHEVCAVKILPRERVGDPQLIENMAHEISVMKAVGEHPCIASGIDTGIEGKEPYLVTRFIRGERLDIRINRLGRLPERSVVLLALRLLSAVTHVYRRGYLFRDMKPQNIIIGNDGGCICDFGICLSIHDTRKPIDPEHVQGSALYYPPERLTDHGEGPYSEIYSLGMVMYHALSGAPYFTAKDIETMTSLNVRKNRLIERKSRPTHIRPDLLRILERMIKREVSERYHSFIDVEHDLLQVLTSRH